MDSKLTLGGFEAVLDSFIPNPNGGLRETEIDAINDEELENIKKTQVDPIAEKVKPSKNKEELEEEEDEIDSNKEDDVDDEEDVEKEKQPKRKSDKRKKEVEEEEDDEDDEDEPEHNDEESNIVTNFFDAIAEKLGWEFNDEDKNSKPKNVDELINYFLEVIEENSKPEYASDEVEALDKFVKEGGDIKKYLTIDAELDLDELDMEDENNQKLVVKQLLKEKGFSTKKIDKLLTRYEEAGLLEDEAQDALEDLKEIKEQKKEQLLKEQESLYKQQVQRQQLFYNNVVAEIKGLKNIRGISVPEKDKKVLIDYILKPDTDGKTKYQKDYAKGGVKNLIESAYFTMNADKLLEAAKREGSNSAIEKFRRNLKSSMVNSKSRQRRQDSSDEPIWFSAARQLRIS